MRPLVLFAILAIAGASECPMANQVGDVIPQPIAMDEVEDSEINFDGRWRMTIPELSNFDTCFSIENGTVTLLDHRCDGIDEFFEEQRPNSVVSTFEDEISLLFAFQFPIFGFALDYEAFRTFFPPEDFPEVWESGYHYSDILAVRRSDTEFVGTATFGHLSTRGEFEASIELQRLP